MIHALLALTILAQIPDLSDISDGTATAAELSRHYQGGRSGSTPIRFVPAWIHLDGTGLPADALQRLDDALTCDLVESPTAYTRLVCAMVQGVPMYWRSGDEWLAYVLIREDVFLKLKDYDTNGPQASRVDLIGGKWSEMKVHAECTTFFTAGQCAAAFPPVVYAGIDPELGD